MKIFVVVDEQNDFITGPLGSREAIAVVENTCNYLYANCTSEDVVICTKDTHFENYLQTAEGKKLPVPHCIINTEGHDLHPALEDTLKKIAPIVDVVYKVSFGSRDLMTEIDMFTSFQTNTEIIFMGLDTDICIASNALMAKAYFPEAPIFVKADCCAGSSEQKHKEALSIMESCQIDII